MTVPTLFIVIYALVDGTVNDTTEKIFGEYDLPALLSLVDDSSNGASP
jgi:hypothetical protein